MLIFIGWVADQGITQNLTLSFSCKEITDYKILDEMYRIDIGFWHKKYGYHQKKLVENWSRISREDWKITEDCFKSVEYYSLSEIGK